MNTTVLLWLLAGTLAYVALCLSYEVWRDRRYNMFKTEMDKLFSIDEQRTQDIEDLQARLDALEGGGSGTGRHLG